jgi:hypothetical protein
MHATPNREEHHMDEGRPSFGEGARIIFLLLTGLLKWPLVYGGAVIIVIGIIFNNALFYWGIAAFIVGYICHAISSELVNREHLAIATAATAGIGPVPPRQVRNALAKRAIRENDSRVEDYREGYWRLVQEWAYEQPGP